MGVWTVCVFLCLLFALNASACQIGWNQYEHKCIKVFNSPKSWKDAEVTCLRYGGNLASVHSMSEYAFLKLLISSSKPYWIGGYSAASRGMWLWSDGSNMNFKLWNTGEPNNKGGKEHCIEMNFRGEGNWNDSNCNSKSSFVCAISR